MGQFFDKRLLKERGDGNKVDLREMGLMMGDNCRWVYNEDGRVLNGGVRIGGVEPQDSVILM
jgi:hypothetical protein